MGPQRPRSSHRRDGPPLMVPSLIAVDGACGPANNGCGQHNLSTVTAPSSSLRKFLMNLIMVCPSGSLSQ